MTIIIIFKKKITVVSLSASVDIRIQQNQVNTEKKWIVHLLYTMCQYHKLNLRIPPLYHSLIITQGLLRLCKASKDMQAKADEVMKPVQLNIQVKQDPLI